MFRIAATATALLALAAVAVSPATAAVTLLANDFDAENGGGSGALNYAGFTDFTVTGNVDLLRSGDFGVTCAGSAGACIDLDGSSSSGGRLETKRSFAVKAGDTVTLSFDMSGNQRGQAADPFTAGFDFGSAFAATQVFATGPSGSGYNSGIGTSAGPRIFQSLAALPSNAAFGRYTVNFTAGQAGRFTAFLATNSRDAYGPIIDNVSIVATPSAAVPEAGTWALMIAGIGGIGGGLRRRRRGARALA